MAWDVPILDKEDDVVTVWKPATVPVSYLWLVFPLFMSDINTILCGTLNRKINKNTTVILSMCLSVFSGFVGSGGLFILIIRCPKEFCLGL